MTTEPGATLLAVATPVSPSVPRSIRWWRQPEMIALAAASVLGGWYALSPPMGTDLSAQVAHGDFVSAFGERPIDFAWYGGVDQLSYSMAVPGLTALIGAVWVGVLAELVFAVAMTRVFLRTGAHRPALGGVLIAVMGAGNLLSGRTTFAAGLAVGACALALALAPIGSGSRYASTRRRVALGALGALAMVTSPVAGIFVSLAAAAWLVAQRMRQTDALALGLGTALGLLPMSLLSDGGFQPYSMTSMQRFVALTVVTALIIPAGFRTLRIGIWLGAGLLVLAYYVPTPLGSNVLRLPMIFAIPVAAAYVPVRIWLTATIVVAMYWWSPPFSTSDFGRAGAPATRASFYQPLLTELGRLGPIGRIEVVPLRDHWESVYVADRVPIARGWLRQVDRELNPAFYGSLTAPEYANWLRTHAVSYVAYAPGQQVDASAASTEAALVASGPDFLRPVWSGGGWTLYQVVAPEPLVSGASLVASTPGGVTVDAPAAGDVLVRVRWSALLSADDGACVAPAPGGWTDLRVPGPGRYALTSGLPRHC
jgi:hypothetical protein